MSGARPIGGETRFAAVIGDPVAHSRSPALHNASFRALGIDAVFLACRVAPGELGAALRGLRALGCLGLSVTVPHKAAVLDHCDRLDASAAAIGAANCLVFEGGELVAHNTDSSGFVDSLRFDLGLDPVGARCVVLGAGGAARAVVAGLREAGASPQVVARSPERAAWTAALAWTPEVLGELFADCELLVDCTSVGLEAATEAELPAPLPLEGLPPSAAVASLIYHRDTALLAAARARGLAAVDGAGMLVYQGARACRLWTGQRAPLADMWRALGRTPPGPLR